MIDPADLDVPLTVSFTLEIRNEARGPLSFDKLGYQLSVNGQQLVTGEMQRRLIDSVASLGQFLRSFLYLIIQAATLQRAARQVVGVDVRLEIRKFSAVR